MSIILSQPDSSIFSALLTSATPALLATTEIVPNAASPWSKADTIESEFVTSMATAIASPPEALISLTNDSSRSTRRAATTTLAPR